MTDEEMKFKSWYEKLSSCPVKLGDIVYTIESCCFRCEEFSGDHCSCINREKYKIMEMEVDSICFNSYGYSLLEGCAGVGLDCYERDFNKQWFTDREAAEARLKELQGSEQ